MIKQFNYKRNISRKQPVSGQLINGQGLGEVSRLRYGICRMSFNGCEVISVYNALTWLGIPADIAEIARYMERYRMLLGFFGCHHRGVGRGLKKFGADFKRVRKPRETGDSRAFIISAWTGIPFLSSIHTVFCVREGGRIKVYNCFNKCPTVREYPAAEDIFKGGKTIAIYII